MLRSIPRTSRTRRSAAFVAGAALATTALAFAGAAPAYAAPAPETIAFTGAPDATVVPAGVCAVTINARGGGGGNQWGILTVLNGLGAAGADITASYPVRPGMPVDVVVGGGGEMSSHVDHTLPLVGAYPDGGGGGAALENRHRGSAGGGSTSVSIDGVELIVAGAGGGLGGGHSSVAVGGDGGLPTAPGVTAGSDGQGGRSNADEPSYWSGGGQGGQLTGPGAGGVLTAPGLDQAFIDSMTGFPGVGRVGGDGGTDPNYDSGAGGGGGYYGGGGGSATDEMLASGSTSVGPDGVGGGGGGGGASYVNPDGPASLGQVRDISSQPGPRANRFQPGPDGVVTLTWIDCGIVTDNGTTSGPIDTVQRWTPTPTNEENGAAVATTIELLDENGDPVTEITLAGVGVYTVKGVEILFTPESGFAGTPSPATYRATDGDGNMATGTYAPTIAVLLPAETPDDQLAATGADQLGSTGAALALIAAGATALIYVRRRLRA